MHCVLMLLDMLTGKCPSIIPYNSGIRFHIQSCNVKGALRCSRYLCNPSDFDNNTMLLFITFTVCLDYSTSIRI